jgi:hypothetical protein
MSQVQHPLPMSPRPSLLRHGVRFPVKFTDGDRCADLDAGGEPARDPERTTRNRGGVTRGNTSSSTDLANP